MSEQPPTFREQQLATIEDLVFKALGYPVSARSWRGQAKAVALRLVNEGCAINPRVAELEQRLRVCQAACARLRAALVEAGVEDLA